MQMNYKYSLKIGCFKSKDLPQFVKRETNDIIRHRSNIHIISALIEHVEYFSDV